MECTWKVVVGSIHSGMYRIMGRKHFSPVQTNKERAAV